MKIVFVMYCFVYISFFVCFQMGGEGWARKFARARFKYVFLYFFVFVVAN